jgi:hypothetical protein
MYKTDLKRLFRRLCTLGVLSACLSLVTLPHPRVIRADPCWECDDDYMSCRAEANRLLDDCYDQRPSDQHQLCDNEFGYYLVDTCWRNYSQCLGNCTTEPRPGTPGGGGEDNNCRARCGTQRRVCRQNNDDEFCTPQYHECLSYCPD